MVYVMKQFFSENVCGKFIEYLYFYKLLILHCHFDASWLSIRF